MFRSIHLTKNVSKLSLLVGGPDTIPSGKDMDTLTRLSNWCGKDMTLGTPKVTLEWPSR